jgi:hypothetical protein
MKRATKIANESLLLPFSADDESQDGRSKGRAVRCLAGAWRGEAVQRFVAKPFARFCLNCHLLRGRKCLMLSISMPVFALQLPVLQNNRKVSRCCCNYLRELANFEREVSFFSPETCFGLKFSKNSLFLRRRPVSLDCIRHHFS